MRPQQGEAGNREMIEVNVCPIDGAVTTSALGPIAAQVHVIVDVTQAALSRDTMEDLVLMAVAASQVAMLTR
jgi:hypothetical protein